MADSRQQMNDALHKQRDWFQVTLSSIGDAVITTDTEGRVTFLNPVAESLTGWTQADAAGQPLEAVFKIVNQETRRTVESPTVQALRDGVVVGLANHTLLISKDGTERPIDDSAAPIRNEQNEVAGVVLVFRDITERYRHEQELAVAASYTDAIIATLREPFVVLTKDLRVRTANHSFYQHFHVTPEETEGRFIYDLGNRQWDIPALRKMLGEVLLNNHAIHDYEVEHDFLTLGKRFMLLNARRFQSVDSRPELILLAIEDISERKQVAEAKAHLSAIVATTKDAIISKDLDGIITSWNRGAERMFGYSAEEVIGKSITLLIPPDHIDEEAMILDRIRKGEVVNHGFETVRRRKDSIPTASSGPEGITAGADGNLWYVESNANNVAAVTTLGSFLEIPIPTSSSSPFDVTNGPDNLIWFTEHATNLIGGKVQWIAQGVPAAPDASQAPLIPEGRDWASPDSGNFHVEVPIDYRVGAGSGNQNAWGLLPGTDVLAYNSATASPRPIVQTTFPSDPSLGVPTSIKAQLTWNNGTPQSWVTYSTTGHSAGDTYLIAQQVANPVTSGVNAYPWKVEIQVYYSSSYIDRITSGTIFVDSNGGASLGYVGWRLGGADRLIGVNGGLQLLYGQQGSRFFEQLTSTTFLSPPNDFGTLVKNGDSTYTYTDPHQVKYNFNSSGFITGLVDPHGLRLTYTYNSIGVSTVSGPDGGVTTFQYDSSNRLTTILQAGGGTVLLTPTGSDLTGATYANNSQRVFSYDSGGLHKLVYDQMSPNTTTVTYDSNTGVITSITLGSGTTQALTPVANQGFGSTAANGSQAVGVATNALNKVTTYSLDSSGRLLQQQNADGGVQSYTLNSAGQVTVAKDPLGHLTTITYDSFGDLTQVQEPDGGIWTYQYNTTFHKVTLQIDPNGDRTTYTLDSTTGDVLQITNALNQVTTQTWTNGELHTVTNPLNQTTTYDYDSTTHRLTDMVDPTGARTTYGYDAQGDVASVENPLGRYTTYTYDGNRNLLQVNYPDSSQVSYAYNAIGEKISQTDQLGHVTASRSTLPARLVPRFRLPRDPTATSGTRPVGR